MKTLFRTLFSSLLNIFEKGDTSYSYKRSHRIILMVVGVLFYVLSTLCLVLAIYTEQLAAGVPFLIFFVAGSVCTIISLLGNDRAVAKIWGNQ